MSDNTCGTCYNGEPIPRVYCTNPDSPDKDLDVGLLHSCDSHTPKHSDASAPTLVRENERLRGVIRRAKADLCFREINATNRNACSIDGIISNLETALTAGGDDGHR